MQCLQRALTEAGRDEVFELAVGEAVVQFDGPQVARNLDVGHLPFDGRLDEGDQLLDRQCVLRGTSEAEHERGGRGSQVHFISCTPDLWRFWDLCSRPLMRPASLWSSR